MKRMRKGIVVLVVAAAGAVGMIGGATAAQASELPEPGPVELRIERGGDWGDWGGDWMPQGRGSTWQ